MPVQSPTIIILRATISQLLGKSWLDEATSATQWMALAISMTITIALAYALSRVTEAKIRPLRGALRDFVDGLSRRSRRAVGACRSPRFSVRRPAFWPSWPAAPLALRGGPQGAYAALALSSMVLAPSLDGTDVIFSPRLEVLRLNQGRTALFLPQETADPLLIFLHPATGSASDSLRFSGFAEAARRQGVSIAFAESRGGFWRYFGANGADDTEDEAYILELRETLVARGLGSRGVFVAGFSNGALLAVQAACRHPGLFQGVGLISAGMPAALGNECRTLPTRVVIVSGAADPVFPVAGGVGRYPMLGSFWALDRFRTFLLSDRRCARFDQTRLNATRSVSARSVIVEQAAQCEREGVSQLFRVVSGGHEPYNEDTWRRLWGSEGLFLAPELIIKAFVTATNLGVEQKSSNLEIGAIASKR